MKINFPLGGLFEGESFAEQPDGTSKDILNVRAVDPITGRRTGAQVAGMSKYCPTVLPGGAKVSDLNRISIDNTKLAFTSLGDAVTQEWSKTQPTPSDCRAFAIDVQSNIYTISFPATIVKYNSEGTVLWTLSLPTGDPANEVRAITVDPAGNVYAAVSNGGAQSKAKMWMYSQQPENTTLQVWELVLGVYVEEMGFRDNLLWTAQNDSDKNQAFVVTYTNVDIPNPTESQRWRIPAPVNGLTLSQQNKSVYTSHQPSARRGQDASSLQTTWISEDWTIKDLARWQSRLYSWHDAKVRDSIGLIENAAGEDDGGIVEIWQDISGNGRHWFGGSDVTGHTTFTGPRYKKVGIGGQPSLSFDGATMAMISGSSAGVDGTFRDSYPQPIPTYVGAQFVYIAVMRVPIENAIRWGIVLPAGGANQDRGIYFNCEQVDATQTSAGGSILLYETGGVASDPGASSVAAFAPTGQGANPIPLAGAIGPYGLVIVTWICDGGDHDVFGTATRSTLRINGQPADRWQSAKFATNHLLRFGDGAFPASNVAQFNGEIIEDICLSDWYDQTGAKQRLITQPNYPDVLWGGGSDTELERLEGWIAHRNGCAHLLPNGTASWLKQVGVAAATQAVTIGAITYTFVNALSGAANEVLVGANGTESYRNLRDAINRTGSPGVTYGAATVQNPDYIALGVIARNNTPQYMLGIRSRNANLPTTALVNPLFGSWTTGNTQTSITPPAGGAFSNECHFPHPFAYDRSGQSVGGPPRTAGATVISNYWRMISKNGILAKWDGTNGKSKWVATSNFDGVGTGIGAVGYACAISQGGGDVYSVGPQQAAGTNPSILADLFAVRKFTDNGDSFSLAGPGDPWEANPAVWTWPNPRLAIDRFGNVFIPWHNTSAVNTSMIAYQKASNGGGLGVPICTVTNIANTPQAFAVQIDANYPSGITTSRPEFVYLATRQEAGGTLVLYKLRLVTTAPLSGSPRSDIYVGVCGGNISQFSSSGVTPITGGTGALAAAADYVSSVAAFKKIFFVDGTNEMVYDPALGTIAKWSSTTSGLITKRAKLVDVWRGRMVLLRFDSDPTDWLMLRADNPFDADTNPPVPDDIQAVQGSTSLAGRAPDLITTFLSWSDDYCILGGQDSIWRLLGDPMQGGKFSPISETIGMSFGRPWCRDPFGNVFFHSNTGQIYKMDLIWQQIVPVTESRIPRRLRDIDLTQFYIRLFWDTRQQGLHVLVFPYGAGGTAVQHFFWEMRGDAWMPEQYGIAGSGVQPTAAFQINGDLPQDRVMLMGCVDGFVRFLDETAKSHDGTTIDSHVLIGPIEIKDQDLEAKVLGMVAELASAQDKVRFEVFVSDTPDQLGYSRASGFLFPGVSPHVHFRARGSYAWLRLSSAENGTRWAWQDGEIKVAAAGRRRVRL